MVKRWKRRALWALGVVGLMVAAGLTLPRWWCGRPAEALFEGDTTDRVVGSFFLSQEGCRRVAPMDPGG